MPKNILHKKQYIYIYRERERERIFNCEEIRRIRLGYMFIPKKKKKCNIDWMKKFRNYYLKKQNKNVI